MLQLQRMRVLALTLLLSAASAPANSADRDKSESSDADHASSEPVYELAAGITAPRVVRQVNPEYSPGSRGVRVVGTVMVALVVTSEGSAKNVHVTRGLDKDVDQSAVDAVKQWRFAPAKKDGKPVAVRIAIEIQFRDL